MIKVCPVCGKEFEVTESRNSLGKGKYCSLECYNKIHCKDITNKKFNKLTALELKYKKQNYDKNNKKSGNREYWLCKCDCGNEVIVEKFHLVHGQIKSCGCLKGGKLTHGLANTRIYKIWGYIKNRCQNNNNTVYKYYGLRGIKVCEEWQKFEPFYEWAINSGYNEQLTIERIDVNGNYEPNNCTWITQKEQANNKRNNHFITYNNETHTIADWAKLYNISYKMLFKRLKDGWNIERALLTPKIVFKK